MTKPKKIYRDKHGHLTDQKGIVIYDPECDACREERARRLAQLQPKI